jgi:hypothetical protein
MAAGIAGLALFAVVMASLLLTTMASQYGGGVVLGAGTVALGWAVSVTKRRLTERRPGIAGRSRTLDCRRVRWHRRRGPVGQPHFPPPADRRVVSCRNSRYPGR